MPVPDAGDLSEIVAKALRLIIFGLLFLVAGGVYLVALLLLKTFTQEDADLLEAALNRARIPKSITEPLIRLLMYGVARPF